MKAIVEGNIIRLEKSILPQDSSPVEGEVELSGDTISIHLAKKPDGNISDIVRVLVNEGYLEKTLAVVTTKKSRRMHPLVEVHGRPVSETIIEDRR